MLGDQDRRAGLKKARRFLFGRAPGRRVPEVGGARLEALRDMDRRFDIAEGVMGVVVCKSVKWSQGVQPEPVSSAVGYGIVEYARRQMRGGLNQRKQVHPGVAARDGEIGRVQRLPERALQQRLVKA